VNQPANAVAFCTLRHRVESSGAWTSRRTRQDGTRQISARTALEKSAIASLP
jgi:hypothetical protein